MQTGLIVHTLITNDKGEVLILDYTPKYWYIAY